MNTTLRAVTVLRATTRNTEPDPKTGEITAFLSLTVLDGYDTLNLWGFANDFTALPSQGEKVDVDVTVRARNGQNGPRLSVRARAIRPAA